MLMIQMLKFFIGFAGFGFPLGNNLLYFNSF